MPIPASILARILQFAIRLTKTAFKGTVLLRKADTQRIGKYFVEITRRSELGADGAISQVIRIYKNGKLQEAWHVVVKAGRIIHKHILK